MRTGNRTQAAIFTLISAGILVTLYALATNFVFSAGPSYVVEFNHAGTISRGTAVSKLGIKIGSVLDLEINPETDTSVLVRIRLDRNTFLREDERLAILTRGMFGDQSVEVYPGSGDAPVAEPGTRFQGEPTVDFASIVADGSRAVRNVEAISEQLREIMQRNLETVDQSVQDIERFTADLSELSASIRSASGNADTLLANLNTAFGDAEIAATIDSIQQASREVARLGENLSAEGSTLSVLQNHGTGDQIQEILANLSELSDNLRIASEGIRLVFEEIEDE